MKTKVVIYSKQSCPFCVRAKQFFTEQGVPYDEIDLTEDSKALEELKNKTGLRTVPQIFINDNLVGGYSDLIAKYESGELVLVK